MCSYGRDLPELADGHSQQRPTPREPRPSARNCSPELTDREILVILYNATDGPNWTNSANWLSNRPLGEWHGVTTHSQGRVTELRLTLNQLKGALPPELAHLTNLQVLALGGNQLTGEIPPWLGSLTNLQELLLGDNELTGEIPAELGRLDKLEELHLSENQLTGCIPARLQDVLSNDLAELGLPFCARSLVDRYDANNNGTIEKSEVIEAINDYLFGDEDETITKAQVIELINLYLFGPS